MSFDLSKIEKCSLCIGCGLCETITDGKCRMNLSKEGFLLPDKRFKFSAHQEEFLQTCCPAINIKCTPKDHDGFGPILEGVEAYALNSEVRFKAASGGAVSAIAMALLQASKVHAILQVGKIECHHMYNELKISKTSEDILRCASSRYAPVPIFSNIISILKDHKALTFAFIGKPCDVMTMKRIVEFFPDFKSNIKYYISIACAGIPSFNATNQLIKKGNPFAKPINVKYRGEGWPGDFKVEYEDGSSFKCDYNKSWGEILGRTLNFRCKICPDGMGAGADIVVGDSWHTENGYPDFTEADGKSFVLVRTQQGKELVKTATDVRLLSVTEFNISSLKDIHQYQYIRLKTAFYKLAAAWILTKGIIKIKNLSIPNFSFIKGIRTAIGTIRRFKYVD